MCCPSGEHYPYSGSKDNPDYSVYERIACLRCSNYCWNSVVFPVLYKLITRTNRQDPNLKVCVLTLSFS